MKNTTAKTAAAARLRAPAPAILFLALYAALGAASCAAAPPPPWAASAADMRQAFPDDEFIAQQGRGATRAAAEADGTAAIARFFSSEVVSRVVVLERAWTQDGESGGRSEIEAETFVQAQMRLFAVRHAPDAYFDRRQGEWVAVAYIDRAEAWRIHGPRLRQQTESFARLFEAAGGETDPFRRALRYTAAQDFARSPDFQNADGMGQLLFPARMDAEFADARAMLAALPQRVAAARMNAPVFIYVPQDLESIVQGAFSRRFAALGFPVTNDRAAAAAICLVTVEEGRRQGGIGVSYFPQVSATITSPVGALFTFSAEGGQQAAANPDLARRRAYQALADIVLERFTLRTDF